MPGARGKIRNLRSRPIHMKRILLADDSPHAQRMGMRILSEEGFEVTSATDGEAALAESGRLEPDVVLADAFLPGLSGYDLCQRLKSNPSCRHVRVVLTAGLLEPLDEQRARAAGCDAIIKKPFEASAVMETIRPLADAAFFARGLFAEFLPAEMMAQKALPGECRQAVAAAQPYEIDPERVRAAITIALDRALPAMIEEITERVLIALGH